jgi:hypothetical protein
MTVIPFPTFESAPIADPAAIAAIETGLSGLCGAITAMGGFVALAGRELLTTPPLERARMLTRMYDAGELVFGWRDGRDGAVVNVVLEGVAGAGGAGGYCAELFVETPQGHQSRGALADRDPAALMTALAAVAATGPDAAALPGRGAALAGLAGDGG